MPQVTKTLPVKVEFQGAILEGVIYKGKNYVAMKPVVEGIGLAWNRQLSKMKEHPALASTMIEMLIVAEDGKSREMACLPEEMLPFWLALVHPNKVKPEIKAKVIKYQIEAANVLHKAFQRGQEELMGRQAARVEAAARYSIMSDVIQETRIEQGKDVKAHHFSNEALMINEALTGIRASLNRDALPKSELRLLSKMEARNAVLIARGYAYAERKSILTRFVAEERARTVTKIEASQ